VPEFLDLHSKTTKALRGVAEPILRRHGLHFGQNYVLAELWREDGRTPGEIAAALRVTTPTITKMATRMAAAGLLVRRAHDRDHRLVRLWLTDAGRALEEPIETELQAVEEEVMTDLTQAERRHMMKALAKVQRSAGALIHRAEAP
jgi:DNA-binding MarR family transcriptional regulator